MSLTAWRNKRLIFLQSNALSTNIVLSLEEGLLSSSVLNLLSTCSKSSSKMPVTLKA